MKNYIFWVFDVLKRNDRKRKLEFITNSSLIKWILLKNSFLKLLLKVKFIFSVFYNCYYRKISYLNKNYVVYKSYTL